MKTSKHFLSSQAAIIIFSGTVGTVYLPLAGIVIPHAKTSGWWIVGLVFFVAAAWLLLVGWLARQTTADNLGAAATDWLGPVFGKIFLFWFASYWFILTTGFLAEISQVFHSTALPNTPPKILLVAALLLLVYTDFRGFDACMRTVQVLTFIAQPLRIAFFASAVVASDFKNLLPLVGAEPLELLKASLLVAPFPLMGILLTLFLGVRVKDRRNLTRRSVWAVWLAALTMVLIIMVTLGVLSEAVIENVYYPTVPLAMSINVGDTLQGVELFVYPFWLISAYIAGAISFILVSSILSALWPGLPRPIRILGLGTLVAAAALMLPNSSATISFLNIGYYYVSLPFYVVLPVLALIVRLRRKGKGK